MTGLSDDKARLLTRLLGRRADRPAAPAITPVPPGAKVPLSPAQARIWFFTRLFPDSVEYNVAETLTFDRCPTKARLRAAVAVLMRRHDALRLRMSEVDGAAVQEDAGEVEPPIEWHDAASAEDIATEAARRPLSTDRCPLFRVVAIRLPAGRALVVLVFHHLIIDHWSVKQLLVELGELLAGRVPEQPADVGYLDYVWWQCRTVDEARIQRELAYWTDKLGGELPVLELPADRPRPAVPSRTGHTVPLNLPTVDIPRRLAEETGTTLFAVLLAAYKVFLHRVTGHTDVLVGAPLAGRDHPVSERIVGCFVKPVALRTAVDGRSTFRALIRRVHETVVDAQDHQTVPYERVVAELDVSRSPGTNPVFQTFFGMQWSGGLEVAGAEVGEVLLDTNAAKWDLTVSLTESDGRLDGFMEYASDLFDEPTVIRFAGMYLTLLHALATEPDRAVADAPLVSAAERHRLTGDLNRYERPEILWRTMAEPFEAQAARRPDAIALVGDEGELTYAELNERANSLARRLRELGAARGKFVAVCAERGFDLVVGLYAVAKSGAAYVPLDPELPDGRLAFMLADTEPAVVLVDGKNRVRIPDGPWHVCDITHTGRNATNLGQESDLVHLLYTSGSTGRPKGVAYPVQGALADIQWMQSRYPYRAGDTAILKTSYGFDVSIWEIFWPLHMGARLVVTRPGGHLDPDHLVELIERHRVTMIFLVPTMAQVFLDRAPTGGCRSLRWVVCGGEAVTPRIRDTFHARFDAALVHGYGPTETGRAVDMVLPYDTGAPTVPLGRPSANFRLYVLDENLEPAPVGVPGEIFIGGEIGLARCYHRRPELTAEKFLPDPFTCGRMYRTGDLGRFTGDGVLYHLGRIGRQVKVRGIRVELAEIEAVCCEHESVADCVAVVDGDRQRIAAFVIARPGREIDRAELVGFVGRLLPKHMVPATFTEVTRIPATVNGKADHAALLRRVDRDSPARVVVPPDGELETRLVAAFRQVLDVTEVGVTDDFFALGGHSMLIFKLLAACTDLRLTVRDVLSAPTVRGLAGRLGSTSDSGVLVPLAASPGRPMLVFVHAASGTVLPFVGVARRLADRFSVYGIEAPDDGPSTVTEMSELYRKAVDEVRGEGPIVLAGWSMGGCVALEMARDWGSAVTATLLLDTWPPPTTPAEADAIRRLDVFAEEGVDTSVLDDHQIARLRKVIDRNREAFLGYQPCHHDGPVDLLRARDSAVEHEWDREMTTHAVPGNHFTMLADENAEMLADVIRHVADSRRN